MMRPDTDRDRGILTKVDREFIHWPADRNEPDEPYYTDRKERWQRRTDIKQRVRDAVLDFIHLESWPSKERREVFDSVGRGDELHEGVISAISFFYNVSKDVGIDFEDLIEEGINRSEQNNPLYESTDVSITVNHAEGFYAGRIMDHLNENEIPPLGDVGMFLRTEYADERTSDGSGETYRERLVRLLNESERLEPENVIV